MRFAALIPDRLADDATPTDAVVVLTGGSGRLDAGLDLLVRGTAGKLFVSGVYRGMDVQRLLQVARRDPAGIEARVALGDAADTYANARETAAWMKAEGFRSLRLVTGAYHMPRSLLEFRHAIPQATMIPHPVFPDHVKANWWAWPGTFGLVIGEYNKLLFAWARNRLKDAAAALGGGQGGERP
ncbi:MAG: YdcF family protein [Rhodospirillales bacterium]|nr:YdcF family protein [Rhodospirillales bacterium]